MHFDCLTLTGLLSAISLAGILYGMTSQEIPKARTAPEEACGDKSVVE